MNITVYLGASAGNELTLKAAVREFGHWIGSSGHTLVYGGSASGLMGELARSSLEAGGRVVGVEPKDFVDRGFPLDSLSELIVTENISERKATMIELGDAFVAFPGGTGTLEEISDVMSRVAMKQLAVPCIIYNFNGYYDGLKSQLEHMIWCGLSTYDRQANIYFANTLEQISRLLEE